MAEIPQPTFPHRAYGVDVTWMGEEGGFGARGHIPDFRFIAACSHLARKDAGLKNMCDDGASLDDVLAVGIDRLWVVPVTPRDSDCEWAVSWHDVTEQTPGALPMTVWLP